MKQKMDFALNHMTVPRMDYEGVIQLAKSLDCVGVEFRNDLGRPLFEGAPSVLVSASAQTAGIRLLGLSQLEMFNDWSDAKGQEAEALMGIAKELGAESISLIPRNDGEGCEDDERQRNLTQALKDLVPMLREAGLLGIIEPLGFTCSSLRRKRETVDAIRLLGAEDCLKLVHDTFHHYLASETDLFPEHTGLVHISGVKDHTLPVDDIGDSDRILVDADDRLGNVAQIAALIASGYDGAFSFECFSPETHAIKNPLEAIAESMLFLETSVAREFA